MKLDRFVVAAAAGAALLCAAMTGTSPALAAPFAADGAKTLTQSSALIRVRHHHRHNNGAAVAVGAVAGAAVVLGALAASQANADETYYAEPPPPPPPPSTVIYDGRGMDETADDALSACRHGILEAARRYGAFDARVGTIDMVRETPDGGHRVLADITVYYPDYERTSAVTCDTRDGYLLSARAED
jgi:hypothetical protein